MPDGINILRVINNRNPEDTRQDRHHDPKETSSTYLLSFDALYAYVLDWYNLTFISSSYHISQFDNSSVVKFNSNIMKTFQLVSLFALVAAAMAFVPNQAPKGKFI